MALYELMSRGKKDIYFFQDSKNSENLFDNSYEPVQPFLEEIRKHKPKNICDFGRTIEFDLDFAGDLMRDPVLIIKVSENDWVPGMNAYFLFEKIQFYQDSILLQEFTGDALWAKAQIDTPFSQIAIQEYLTSFSSSNGNCRVSLPLIGCQQNSLPSKVDDGFPQQAVTKHSYHLKCKIRKLDTITRIEKGNNWNKKQSIDVYLETTQVYLTNEKRKSLQEEKLSTPFRVFTENRFEIPSNKGAGSILSVRLEAYHPSGRILWFVRKLGSLASPGLESPGFQNLSLLIAGQVRESSKTPFIWQSVNQYAKEIGSTDLPIYTMNWTLGNTRTDVPTGTINFTEADKPTLYIQLPSVIFPHSVEFFVVVEGWTNFMAEGGRGELLSR